MNDKIVLIVKETHNKDDYYEDDYGHECHCLSGETKVDFVECQDVPTAKTKYQEIAQSNADNPPYDEYNVMMAYWKESKVIIPLRMLEGE